MRPQEAGVKKRGERMSACLCATGLRESRGMPVPGHVCCLRFWRGRMVLVLCCVRGLGSCGKGGRSQGMRDGWLLRASCEEASNQ